MNSQEYAQQTMKTLIGISQITKTVTFKEWLFEWMREVGYLDGSFKIEEVDLLEVLRYNHISYEEYADEYRNYCVMSRIEPVMNLQ